MESRIKEQEEEATLPEVREEKEGEGAVDVNNDEIAVLKEEVQKFRDEAQQNYDKYLRSVAELENFKKRSVKERADLMRYAGEGLARDLLEIVDGLELALQHESKGEAENTQSSEIIKGVKLVLDRFVAILGNHSIKGESGVGSQFNPERHEALATVPTIDHPPGTIVQEYKKAYFFKDKLLRPGQVVTSVQPLIEEAKLQEE